MEEVRQVLLKRNSKTITCQEAHSVAESFGIDPFELGHLLDELQIKIIACQLGLFGYGERKKDLPFVERVDEGIQRAIEERLRDGRLPCKDAWDIAKRHGVSRKYMGGVCESLGIKISSCQLNAF